MCERHIFNLVLIECHQLVFKLIASADIVDYGYRLGVDPTEDKVLCAIIRGWILQPLPHYWFPWYPHIFVISPCQVEWHSYLACLPNAIFFTCSHDVQSQNWFYFNSLNGQSSWKHPLEDIHQTLAKEYLRKHPTSRSTGISHKNVPFTF